MIAVEHLAGGSVSTVNRNAPSQIPPSFLPSPPTSARSRSAAQNSCRHVACQPILTRPIFLRDASDIKIVRRGGKDAVPFS